MHIVFCVAPFSGHVNPSLAVVSELARRGHRVSYVTTSQFAPAVRDRGGHPVIYRAAPGHFDGGADSPAGSPGPVSGDVTHDAADFDFARGLAGQLRELRPMLAALIPAFAKDVPDVVVCDPTCWAGRALAARWGTPAINNVTTMIGKARWSLGPIGATFDPASRGLPRLLAATSAVLASHGIGLTAADLLGAGGDIPVIAYHPRAFEAEGDRFGPDIHFVGPCLPVRHGAPFDRLGQDPSSRPPRDKPVILVSLGTVFNRQAAFMRRCIDALAELDCYVVAALGGMDSSTLGTLPSNARAHDHVPLPEVLWYADVLVGHAGMTSTMEAMSFGVPVAALPQIPEQGANADRLAELGLGLRLDPARLTAERLRQAVTTLLHDASVRSRLAWMCGEIQRAPGASWAAEVIENASRMEVK